MASITIDARACVVAYKGGGETDSDRLRAIARRLDHGFDLGGGASRAVVIRILLAAAEQLDANGIDIR